MIANEAIAKAVAEVTTVAIQAIAAAAAERSQSVVGCKIGGPAMQQPSFNWGQMTSIASLKTSG